MKTLCVLIAVALPALANAEVISYTMGIDVNCPSGLSE